MKKGLLMLLMAAFLVFSVNAEAQFSGGDGSPGDPYVITDCQQLQEMNCDLTAYYVLGDDIVDWSTCPPFVPVGYGHYPFTGNLDGQGFTISGLTITGTTAHSVGLFGHVGPGCQISNVTLEDVYVEGDSDVGALAGTMTGGAISNCQVIGISTVIGSVDDVGGLVGRIWESGSITGSQTINVTVNNLSVEIYTHYTGGLVGRNRWGIITDCSAVRGIVTGEYSVGGLVGWNSGPIIDSDADMDVSGVYGIGGLAGLTDGGSISGCDVAGTVDATGNYVGGLAGGASSGCTISDSHTAVTVTADGQKVGGLTASLSEDSTISNSSASGITIGSDRVGGLVGQHYGSITESFATGDVRASGTGNGNWIGGLVGGMPGGSIEESFATGNVEGNVIVGGLVGSTYLGSISNSYARGNATATGDFVGGLIGICNTSQVENCYSTGYVSGLTRVAGLIGYNQYSSVYTANFWDIETSGTTIGVGNLLTNPPGVTGKTTAEMQTKSTFTDAGWGFCPEGTIWAINDGFSYPCLNWGTSAICTCLVSTDVILDEIDDTFQELPDDCLKSGNPKISFHNQINAVKRQIENGAYRGAINHLKEIRDNKVAKWIVGDCGGLKDKLTQAINSVIAYLETLL